MLRVKNSRKQFGAATLFFIVIAIVLTIIDIVGAIAYWEVKRIK